MLHIVIISFYCKLPLKKSVSFLLFRLFPHCSFLTSLLHQIKPLCCHKSQVISQVGGEDKLERKKFSHQIDHQSYARPPCAHTQSLHLRHGKGRNSSARLEDNSRTALSGCKTTVLLYIYLPNQALRKANKTRHTALSPWIG